MRNTIMIAFLLIILGIFNYGIYQKEQIIKHGEIMFLQLAPVDPRSLMQGDYMQLRYAIELTANRNIPDNSANATTIVIKADENNVGQFVRFHQNEELANGEKLLHAHEIYRRIRIVPNSFLFQEGHEKYYQAAQYGVFKFDKNGNSLLIGLADRDRQLIAPKI